MANPNPFLQSPADALVEELAAQAAKPIIMPELPKPEPETAPEQRAITLPTDKNLPAGMRNNNPGNIKYVGQRDAVGPSVNRDQGDPQAVYATAEDGMAAMFRLALKKYNGGKTTASALIASKGGWTPGNEQAAANVARTMGLSPNDDLNLSDPAMMKKFARALMLQEHGPASKAYTDDMIARVADSVASGAAPRVINHSKQAGAPDLQALQQKLDAAESGRYKVLPAQSDQPDLQALQQKLDGDEAGRYKVLPPDYAATHFSPTLMDRNAYEQAFRQNNPGASPAAIAYAMGEFDKQQVPAKAPPLPAVPTPEQFFDERLNQRLQQGGAGGIVPALPGKQDGLPSPGTPVPTPADPNQQSFLERAGDALSEGMDNTMQSLGLARFAVAGGDSTEIADELAAKFALQAARPQTEGQKEIDAAFQKVTDAEGAWETTKAGFGALGTALSNPKDLAVEIAGQAPNMLPTLATGAAGAGVGAGTGFLAGGWGAIPGAVVGGRAGMAVGTTATELGAEVEQMVRERLAQGKQAPTAANIKALLDSEDFRTAARNQGLAKGLTVAAVDQLFLGLGGKVASKAADAATIPGKVALGAGAVATDAAGEVTGEALSQQVARGEVDAGDALREGVMSLGQSAVEPVIGAGMRAATGGQAEAAPAAPAQPATVPPTQVAPVPAEAAPAPKSRTPLSSSLEDTAEQPQRVVAVTADGEVAAGKVLDYREDGDGKFIARIVGDDGQTYTVTDEDGVQLVPVEAPKGPLTASLETAAEQHAAEQAVIEPQAASGALDATGEGAPPAPVATAPVATAPEAAAPVEAPAVRAEPPAPAAPADMSDEQLRSRMKYLAGQFKNASDRSIQTKIAVEKRAIEKEINARAQAVAASTNQPAEVTSDGNDGAAGDGRVRGDRGAVRDGGADEQGLVRDGGVRDAGRGAVAGDGGAGAEFGAIGVPDAGQAADAQPALNDPHLGQPFVSDTKARAYIAKNRIGATHYVKRVKPGEFEIRRRPGAGATMDAATDKIARQEEAVRKAAENLAARQAAKAAVAAPQTEIDAAAHTAATSPTNGLPEPTAAQKEAGNYAKGHIKVHGLDISVENPRGSTRSGQRPDGSTWSHEMSDHYGYIKRTEGADGEQIDVYVGPKPDSDRVFVVDQLNQSDGSFDEHKAMLGYPSKQAALRAYKSNFDKGWKVGPVRQMSVDEFKGWLKEGDTTKPAAEHAAEPQNAPQNIPKSIPAEGEDHGVDQRSEQQPDVAETIPGQEALPAEQASTEAQEEVSEPVDDLAGIPLAFVKRTKVPLDVWVQDEGVYETVDIPADQALASVREDIANLRSLLDCLRS